MKKAEKILNALGGIQASLPESRNRESDITFFEKNNDLMFPSFFRNFMIKYAPFSFNKLVKKKMDVTLGGFIDGNLSIDYFYSFNKETKRSIPRLLEVRKEQIPNGFIPFCDGEAGDFICICLIPKQFGEIYYFHHEAIEENLIKISDSFEEFLEGLVIEEDEPLDVTNWKMPEEVKKNSTDDFLKMLEEWKKKNQ